MNKIHTLKGFTIPKGYTLVITKQDGSVLEKQEGERSGGAYSFEQIAAGENPDWELSGAGNQPSQSQVAAPKQEAPKPQAKVEVKPARPSTLNRHDLYLGNYSEMDLKPGVGELLNYSEPKFREKLVQLFTYEQLSGMTASELAKNSEFLKHSGYIDESVVEVQINRAKEKLKMYGQPPFKGADYTLNAMILYREFSPRTRMQFESARDFMHKVVEDVGYVKIQDAEKVEPALPPEKLPKLIAGQFDEKTLEVIFSQFKNPANIRKIFENYENPNAEKAAVVREKAEALRAEILGELKKRPGSEGKMTFQQMNEKISASNAAKKELETLDDTTAVSAFRRYINGGGRHLEDHLSESRYYYFKKHGIKHEVFSGLMFGLNFFHEELVPHQNLTLSKSKDRRASAGVTDISLTKSSTPSVAAHEFGHIVESQISSVMVANTIPFLFSRISPHEVSMNLADVTGVKYDPWEAAFEDHFGSMYIGKLYSAIVEEDYKGKKEAGGKSLGEYAARGGIYATEVVSMGLQQMFDNPFEFAQRDWHHFEFIWSLRSNPKMLVRQ